MDEEFRNQYRPRMWSKRLPEQVIVEKHCQITAEMSQEVRNDIPFEVNVQYGDGSTNLMDIYGKDTIPKDSPIFVYIHGGYWYILDKSISCYCVKPLWKAGIRVCVPDYDLAPKVTMDHIVNQVQTMAKFVLDLAVERGSRSVWFGGHSAGGHLSASLLDENWLKKLSNESKSIFKGIILISGIYDLVPILRTEFNDNLKMSYDDAVKYSPISKVTNFIEKSLIEPDFKALFVLAEQDSEAFKDQSKAYMKLLNEVNIDTEYFYLPDVDHFNMVEDLRNDSFILTKRIISLVKGEEKLKRG